MDYPKIIEEQVVTGDQLPKNEYWGLGYNGKYANNPSITYTKVLLNEEGDTQESFCVDFRSNNKDESYVRWNRPIYEEGDDKYYFDRKYAIGGSEDQNNCVAFYIKDTIKKDGKSYISKTGKVYSYELGTFYLNFERLDHEKIMMYKKINNAVIEAAKIMHEKNPENLIFYNTLLDAGILVKRKDKAFLEECKRYFATHKDPITMEETEIAGKDLKSNYDLRLVANKAARIPSVKYKKINDVQHKEVYEKINISFKDESKYREDFEKINLGPYPLPDEVDYYAHCLAQENRLNDCTGSFRIQKDKDDPEKIHIIQDFYTPELKYNCITDSEMKERIPGAKTLDELYFNVKCVSDKMNKALISSLNQLANDKSLNSNVTNENVKQVVDAINKERELYGYEPYPYPTQNLDKVSNAKEIPFEEDLSK